MTAWRKEWLRGNADQTRCTGASGYAPLGWRHKLELGRIEWVGGTKHESQVSKYQSDSKCKVRAIDQSHVTASLCICD
jgi:hypothetical protein